MSFQPLSVKISGYARTLRTHTPQPFLQSPPSPSFNDEKKIIVVYRSLFSTKTLLICIPTYSMIMSFCLRFIYSLFIYLLYKICIFMHTSLLSQRIQWKNLSLFLLIEYIIDCRNMIVHECLTLVLMEGRGGWFYPSFQRIIFTAKTRHFHGCLRVGAES